MSLTTTEAPPSGKTPKSAMIRFRCDASIKDELERMAASQELDVADILRYALRGVVKERPQIMENLVKGNRAGR